MTTSLQ